MFVFVIVGILYVSQCFATQLNIRVVELGSTIKLNSNGSTKLCTIMDSEGCTFDVAGNQLISIEITDQRGLQFSSQLNFQYQSPIILYVHLKRKSHYLVYDDEIKVGDWTNQRLMAGAVIPQTTGKRRAMVHFGD